MIRRFYDPKHIPKLIEYARGWHAKSVLCNIPIDVPRSTQLLKHALMSPDAAVWASFDDRSKVRGILIGSMIDWLYLRGRYATDLLFIADRDGLRLYRAFEQWAASHGANSIQMGVSSGLPQADKFFDHLGLARVGGIYFREVTP